MSDKLIEILSTNLKRLRAAKGISQESVARDAGLSARAFSDIENGKAQPRVSTLQAIARALDVRLADLLAPTKTLRGVRFRSNKKLRSRDQIICEVEKWLSNYNDLEEMVSEKQAYLLSDLENGLSPINAAHKAREKLGLTPTDPIRDLCGLLSSAGIKLKKIYSTADGFWGLSVAPQKDGPAIVVNAHERIPVERVIFSAAHELGHLILHSNDYDSNLLEEEEQTEKEANSFAAEFLMPDEVFQKEWNASRGLSLLERVLKVKRIFHVSHQTVLSRLSESQRSGANIYMMFNAAYKKKYGKSLSRKEEFCGREPFQLTTFDFQEDRLARLVRKALESEKISVGRGAEILEIDIGEMRDLVNAWVG